MIFYFFIQKNKIKIKINGLESLSAKSFKISLQKTTKNNNKK